MKITLMTVGKTSSPYVAAGLADYAKRIARYHAFEIIELPGLRKAKNLPEAEQKEREGAAILKKISPAAHVVLLDEHGRQHTSPQLAQQLNRWLLSGKKQLVFLIGGAYGFSDALYQRADERLALSKMTFSHQIVRLLFAEQLYRAFTILRNEPYHHG